MKISLVAAMTDKDHVIGFQNKLPWPKLKQDMDRFRQLTLDKHVLMGRKTFESIGKPLPQRVNFVLSKNPEFKPEGVLVFPNISNVYEYILKNDLNDVMVIGGEKIYQSFLPLTDIIYLTRIYAEYEGDAYFPEVDFSKWEVESEPVIEENGIRYQFFKYSKFKR